MPFSCYDLAGLAPGGSPEGEAGRLDFDGDLDVSGLLGSFEAGRSRCERQADRDSEQSDGGSKFAFSVIPRQPKNLIHVNPFTQCRCLELCIGRDRQNPEYQTHKPTND